MLFTGHGALGTELLSMGVKATLLGSVAIAVIDASLAIQNYVPGKAPNDPVDQEDPSPRD